MSSVLQELASWREREWLGRLDVALARFCAAIAGDEPAPPALLLAAALVSRLEGLGHSCLPLSELEAGDGAIFGWKAATLAGIRARWVAHEAASPAWHRHPLVGGGTGQEEASPFVFEGGRFYLRRLWNAECMVRDTSGRLAGEMATFPPALEPVARRWLDRLFPAPSSGSGPDRQREACEVALCGRFTVITGGPGTGKTYTAARLYALWCLLHEAGAPRSAPGLRIALAAPTGKAAGRLEQSITSALESLTQEFGEEWPASARPDAVPKAETLHRLLGARPDTRRFKHDAGCPLDCDVLFVDEASMVDLGMMAGLLEALRAQARLVLLGDKDQLASVEAGAVLADLCRAPAGSLLQSRIVALTRSHRFEGAIGRLADAVNRGAVDDVQAALAGGEGVEGIFPASPMRLLEMAIPSVAGTAHPGGYIGYLQWLRQRPADAAGPEPFEGWVRELLRIFDTFRILCAVNDGAWGVDEVNRQIESRIRSLGYVATGGDWYEGRPVMVRRNDSTLGVSNGDVGIVLRSHAGGLRAWFADGARLRSVGISRLPEVETAFALTVHKSQGSEFGHVVVALGADSTAVLARELLYTGVTRARQRVSVVAESLEVVSTCVLRRTHRAGGLGVASDPEPA